MASPRHSGRNGKVRRGLLYMLLAAVIHYFSGGYGALNLPFPINPVVTLYLAPWLFLNGLAFVAYEFIRRNWA